MPTRSVIALAAVLRASLFNARLLWVPPRAAGEAAAFGANLGLAGRPRAWGATLLVRM